MPSQSEISGVEIYQKKQLRSFILFTYKKLMSPKPQLQNLELPILHPKSKKKKIRSPSQLRQPHLSVDAAPATGIAPGRDPSYEVVNHFPRSSGRSTVEFWHIRQISFFFDTLQTNAKVDFKNLCPYIWHLRLAFGKHSCKISKLPSAHGIKKSCASRRNVRLAQLLSNLCWKYGSVSSVNLTFDACKAVMFKALSVGLLVDSSSTLRFSTRG